ncbi:hypothetical protein [Hymenobacter lapidiphilus]|uniref:Uncharacterized protein n=1 Tax=Hymenobacter lapidiphilus TaxID=2608003 RepID=A0A7Y7PS09_9BACT|nr:hypothetical protein [Hymenobacter lapidiphilus]NVO32627.1 hypothetical protein [Hymenobacter lapidiphilus]
MHKLLRGRWWVAGLLLAASCRSEQAIFSFRPAAAEPVSVAVPVASVSSAATSPAAPLGAGQLAARSLAAPIANATVAPAEAPGRPAARQLKQTTARLKALTSVRARRPGTATHAAHRDTLHWVLGAALVVAGVVGGILLGGWLGLGVGAVLVLLGYYFVVLGLGGRQAWLEVFQEFFNM